MANAEPEASTIKKIISACFYGGSSILIMIVNKSVLTNYKFPSPQFLGFGQIITAVLMLSIAKALGCVSFSSFNKEIPSQIFPLPIIFFGNLITGLGGTKQISLPMFTVLRRFTILITMVLEIFLLGKRPSLAIVISVLSMIVGAIIAAGDDLAFDLVGYIYIFWNNIFTASNYVYIKKKLNDSVLNKYGLIFYNSLFMALPCFFFVYVTGDLEQAIQFEHWSNLAFVLQFFLSCVMGFVINFSMTLCTAYNSPLTTTVVGSIKNIAITYIGLFFGGDYVYSFTNFIGINISVIGGVVYSYIVFVDKKVEEKKVDNPPDSPAS